MRIDLRDVSVEEASRGGERPGPVVGALGGALALNLDQVERLHERGWARPHCASS